MSAQRSYVTQSPFGETELRDCLWYHTFDFNAGVPGLAPDFDLREQLDGFLLPADMRGRGFLDVGCANGFFGFEAERRGAHVVSFDLGPGDLPDHIPYPGLSLDEHSREFHERVNKGYWHAHRRLGSRARMVYGSVMRMPDWLPAFDVAMLSCILQHLRDPLGALIEADRHCSDTLIVCEAYHPSEEPILRFCANPEGRPPQYWTWWLFSPAFLVRALATLGYERIEVHGPFDLHHRDGYAVPSVTVRGHKRR